MRLIAMSGAVQTRITSTSDAYSNGSSTAGLVANRGSGLVLQIIPDDKKVLPEIYRIFTIEFFAIFLHDVYTHVGIHARRGHLGSRDRHDALSTKDAGWPSRSCVIASFRQETGIVLFSDAGHTCDLADG